MNEAYRSQEAYYYPGINIVLWYWSVFDCNLSTSSAFWPVEDSLVSYSCYCAAILTNLHSSTRSTMRGFVQFWYLYVLLSLLPWIRDGTFWILGWHLINGQCFLYSSSGPWQHQAQTDVLLVLKSTFWIAFRIWTPHRFLQNFLSMASFPSRCRRIFSWYSILWLCRQLSRRLNGLISQHLSLTATKINTQSRL